MLSKAKQEREKRLAEMKRLSKAKAQVQKAAREKDEKEKRIQEQLSQWCLKKRLDNDLKKLKVSRVCSCGLSAALPAQIPFHPFIGRLGQPLLLSDSV